MWTLGFVIIYKVLKNLDVRSLTPSHAETLQFEH